MKGSWSNCEDIFIIYLGWESVRYAKEIVFGLREMAKNQSSQNSSPTRNGEIRDNANLTILLIEDREIDADIVARHLKKCFSDTGFTLVWKSTLKDSLEALQQSSFDILITDLQLPDGAGVDVYRKLAEKCPNLPTIILSSSDDDLVAKEAIELGAQDFINKNQLSAKLLEKTIQYALSRHRLRTLLVESAIHEKDEALKVSKLKSLFLATMSHEIRTPMNGVIGATSMLIRTPLTPEQREYVETIRSSGRTLITLINDILDYSKIEAGKLDLEKTQFKLRNVVEETIDLFSEAALDKGLILVGLVDPNIPQIVQGDPGRLGQVFNNLVSNAIKFTENGKVELRASLVKYFEGKAVIHFTVSDTGRGMSADFQANLFQAFSQEKSNGMSQVGGTGLGLSICKKLIHLMGGDIHCDSIQDKGSQFYWDLEFEAANLVPFKPRAEISGKRVGLVTRDSAFSDILSTLLSNRGLISQRIPEEDLQASLEVDCLILDGRIRKWHALENHLASIPCIVLEARGQNSLTSQNAKQISLGFPFRQSQFYERLAEILQGEECTRNAQSSVELEKKTSAGKAQLGKILVVEDNLVNQKIVVRMLEKMGYLVEAVSDGKSAIESVIRKAPDLVLMDCQMPEMDGYETTRRLRETGAMDLPIVAITANAFAEDREKCLASGMNDYLAKPVQWEPLEQMIQQWIVSRATEKKVA